MNASGAGAVSRFLAITTASVSAAMSIPIAWSIATGDGGLRPLVLSCVFGLTVSALCALLGRRSRAASMGIREAILAVVLSWMGASFIIGLPYLFSGAVPCVLDAVFEGVSGFTTTGATVLPNLGLVPRSILLWRSFSQWVGGLGIIVLTLAVFPVSGAVMQLYKSEVSGPVHERLTPRIQQTAAFLWKTYIVLTTLQAALLMAGGLGLFDALTLAFSTIATGGFSPYPDNVGHFAGNYVKWITAIFLFLAAANLTFYHALIVRRNAAQFRENPEFRFYVSIFVVFGILTSLLLYQDGIFASFRTAVLEGFFHTISMLSTCGFFISDYNTWPSAARHLMLILMFCGGCAISTSGGITCLRVVIVLKHIQEEFIRLLHPRAVIPTRLGREAVDAGVVSACFAFFAAYIGVFALGFVLVTLFGLDMTTAISGVAATLGNVGPGFGMVGPAESYAYLPSGVKLVYIALMLCGRLEIFTLLLVFSPRFWRR